MEWQERRLAVLPLFHPAAALRARDLMPRLEAGFQALGELLREQGPADAVSPTSARGRVRGARSR